MHPVVIAATGGVGNQLFQFAAALAVADETGAPARTCCRMYDRPWHRRAFVAARAWIRSIGADADERFRWDAMQRRPDLLRIQDEAPETCREEEARLGLTRNALKHAFRGRAAPAGMRVVRTSDHVESLVREATRSPGVPGLPFPVLIAGHLQGDRFVAPRIERIRSVVRLPRSSRYLDEWLALASRDDSVAIHVRRGDYLKPAYRHSFPIIPARWFADAAARLRALHGDLRCLVITDDPGWARDNLALPGEACITSTGRSPTAIEDLAIIAACRHQIVSNSTFGWWGARLANRAGSTVAPTLWEFGKQLPTDFLPPGWITLENPPTRA
jgi:hypothetical protein